MSTENVSRGARAARSAGEPLGGAVPYAVAVGAAGAALLLRVAIGATLGPDATALLLLPAVLASAWYGGLGPGLLSTALSAVATVFLFPPAANWLPLVLFVLTGAGIAALSHRLRASAALAASRAERLNAIIDTTVDAIIVIDASGHIEAFNRGAERVFGYRASDVLGRNVSLLMPSPHHEAHDSYLQRYLATGQAKIIGTGREVSGRRQDGSVVPLHLSVGEMVLDGRRMFTGMLHDLSRRVALETSLRASEARWRAIVDSAVDGIVVIDAHGRIEAFNPAAERLFGFAESEMLGRNVDVLMPSPYREEHDGYLARYLATGQARVIGIGREVTARRKDGTTFPVHLSVGEMAIQGEPKFTGILHDLSGRARMEARLREQAALARLGEMAAVVAHEVKNPLAGVRGAVQVFASRLPSGAAESRVLEEIITRIDALDRLMKDLLLFARPPKPNRRATDVVPLVAATAGLMRQDPAMHGVVVDVAGASPPILVDPEMLKIVVHNLLLNSAHAMKGQGRVSVNVSADHGTCCVIVADAGPGIPVEARDRIFAPFFTTKSRGSGLGLATAKRFVEAHGGEIAVDCPAEGGTTVHVRLPLDGSPRSDDASAPHDARSPRVQP